MPTITTPQQQAIEAIVSPDRARFDTRERRIYSHDTGVLPGAFRLLAGPSLADGVAQPESEAQVVELVRYAVAEGIPLVPRGKATSGYGGVVPAHGGLVLDLTRLKGIVWADPEDLTVTVRAGTVWQDLEEALAAYGLALRLYPTSAPASTIGGWLAQGGAGIGSHMHGWFVDNVLGARIVTGTGEVREVAGPELAAISDAEGTTGIITEVTLAVRRAAEQASTAVSFPDAQHLTDALKMVTAQKLPIWSITFVNPTMARLKNAGPPKTHQGHPLPSGPALPEDAYVVLFSYETDQAQIVVDGLRDIAATTSGRRLPAAMSRHEWDERFKPMRLKRLGPSVVPAEVVVPLANLPAVLDDLAAAIKAPLAIEGLSVHGQEIVLLGFIPHDERTLGYTFGYGYALSAIRVAERHGGRAYSTGRYFSSRADSILGPARIEAMKLARGRNDPSGILNPGKLVFGTGLIGGVIGLAAGMEPLVRTFANVLGRPAEPLERKAPAKGFPADVASYAYACAQCGYCVDTCTLYQGRGWESSGPRGKWSFLKDVLEGKDKFDQQMTDTFLLCTTCEKCDVVCQLDLPIEPTWGLLRGNLVQDRGFGTFPPFEIMASSLKGQKNIWGGLQDNRDQWVTEELKPVIKPTAKIAYFAGCTASFVEQDIAQSAVKLLDAAGVDFTTLGKDEMCCGIPMLVAGKWELFEEALRHNTAAMQAKGVEEVITSCPACWLVWNTYYPQWAEKLGIPFDFKAKHYSQILAEKISAGEFALTEVPESLKGLIEANGTATVTFHDSCHIGRAGGVYEPPRDLIRAIPNVQLVEMAHSKEDSMCCGSVLTRIGEPHPTSEKLGGMRIAEAEATGADALLALCPCCQFQLRVSADEKGSTLPVIDLARLAAEALGVKGLPDPNPEVLSQWAMFEKFIMLMSPDGMVGVMDALTPNLLDAMPLGMGAMMRTIGHAPAVIREPMFKIMAPMMPVLFPILLPGMMPEVLPHMIRLVEQTIDMPDYLRNQLPDLFPEVVDNVMPKMLPQITPKYVPILFDHLRN
ncbi:MAG TPA: FAD-binding and (Fe-S)-binding domain-containing protein [Ktedonobacterales bacterium]|nr:FAD-binding and (Fe-S)-binding domain-containing protein [Ktedonobacterales bacterium]